MFENTAIPINFQQLLYFQSVESSTILIRVTYLDIHFFPGLQLVLKSHAPCGKRETMRKWKQFFPKMYAGQMPQVTNGDVV